MRKEFILAFEGSEGDVVGLADEIVEKWHDLSPGFAGPVSAGAVHGYFGFKEKRWGIHFLAPHDMTYEQLDCLFWFAIGYLEAKGHLA